LYPRMSVAGEGGSQVSLGSWAVVRAGKTRGNKSSKRRMLKEVLKNFLILI